MTPDACAPYIYSALFQDDTHRPSFSSILYPSRQLQAQISLYRHSSWSKSAIRSLKRPSSMLPTNPTRAWPFAVSVRHLPLRLPFYGSPLIFASCSLEDQHLRMERQESCPLLCAWRVHRTSLYLSQPNTDHISHTYLQPTCHQSHLPPYLEKLEQFKAKGVDVLAVFAANDPFVMSGWAKVTGLKDKVRLPSFVPL